MPSPEVPLGRFQTHPPTHTHIHMLECDCKRYCTNSVAKCIRMHPEWKAQQMLHALFRYWKLWERSGGEWCTVACDVTCTLTWVTDVAKCTQRTMRLTYSKYTLNIASHSDVKKSSKFGKGMWAYGYKHTDLSPWAWVSPSVQMSQQPLCHPLPQWRQRFASLQLPDIYTKKPCSMAVKHIQQQGLQPSNWANDQRGPCIHGYRKY